MVRPTFAEISMRLQVPRSELQWGARAKSECGKDHVGLNTITF